MCHQTIDNIWRLCAWNLGHDTAFGMVERCTGALVPSQWYAPAGTLTSVHDTARRSAVIRLAAGSYAHHGRTENTLSRMVMVSCQARAKREGAQS